MKAKRYIMIIIVMSLMLMLSTNVFAAKVLMYHEVLPVSSNEWQITSAAFESQMLYLKDNGFIVNTADKFNYKLKTNKLTSKDILITFDDGCYGSFAYAMPILMKYKFSAGYSITPKFLGTTGYQKYMTLSNVNTLYNNGFEIMAHGWNHESFGNLKLQEQARLMRQTNEFLHKYNVKYMCLPYGSYNNATIKAAITKYELLFSSDEYEPKSGDFLVGRYCIYPSTNISNILK